MDLKTLPAVLLRRWYIVLLVIGCTVGTTFFVAAKVGPTYEAQASVLVFPPVATVQRDAETVTQGNPYLALDGVGQARDIVIRELTSKKTADEFDTLYPGTTFEATPDVMNNAPIILITVESPTGSTAVKGASELVARVPLILKQLQEGLGLDKNSVITSRPLTADQRPESLHKNQIRAAVVAAVVTLGLGLLAVGFLDGVLTDRKKKVSVKPPNSVESRGLAGAPPSAATSSDNLGSSAIQRKFENAQARPVGSLSTRLRPRSSGSRVASNAPDGAPSNAHGPNDRTKVGSHGTAGSVQRR